MEARMSLMRIAIVLGIALALSGCVAGRAKDTQLYRQSVLHSPVYSMGYNDGCSVANYNWQRQQSARDKKSFDTDSDYREGWLAGMSSVYFPGDGPTQERLLKGMLNGEVGSLQEGPSVNEPAPDFTLKTHDGSQTIRLADRMGRRPVVLMFGNFTCGPFRSMCPGVEEAHRRFDDAAEFLGIYVREAHPTDGWKMFSNTRVGVEVAQPTTNDERRAVAAQCHRLLKLSFPWLVDEIDDPVGNAYSGMPTRLYVIDSAGRVAYKGGRGPFGFSVGEMEQALVMTLLAEHVQDR